MSANDASNLTGNPWLAEVYAKDPWEAVILINPATAERKGLRDGEAIIVESRYGRLEGRLRVSELFHPDAVGVGGSYGLGTLQSNPLNRLGPNFNALLSLDDKTFDAVSGGQDTAPAVKVYRKREGPMRYGMVIDLQKCVGCNSCTLACRAEQGTPAGIHFHRVVKYETGRYPNAKMRFLPMPCMHCQDPPCLKVCPTGATSQSTQGLVRIDHDRCIGCRACLMACPYDSRQFLWEIGNYYGGQLPTPYERVKQKQFDQGTVVKCDFCERRLSERKEARLC